MQVLAGLADGLTLGQIATEWGLTYATVRNHSIALRLRLGANTLPHAMAIAHRDGLFTAGRRS